MRGPLSSDSTALFGFIIGLLEEDPMDMVDALKKGEESERLGHHFMSRVNDKKLLFVTFDSNRPRFS